MNGTITFEIERTAEGKTLKADCMKYPNVPSLEDDPYLMREIMTQLVENPDVIRIVLSQAEDYDYDFYQTRMLVEIAKIYLNLVQDKRIVSFYAMGTEAECKKCYASRHSVVKDVVYRMLKEDPISAYVKLKRDIRSARIVKEKRLDAKCMKCDDKFISILTYLMQTIEQTELIKAVKHELSGFKIGDRTPYKQLFAPTTRPNFMYTRLMSKYPSGEEIGNYMVDDTEVTVFKMHDSVRYLYHMMPPEFKLSEEKYELLNAARNIMAEHKPTKSEFIEPERMREVFKHIGTDLISELAKSMAIQLSQKELDQIADILLRYTIGFGLIETLMKDENVQDVTVNSPLGSIPLFIVHGEFGDCYTNIYPMPTEAESWATKMRLISGRPLDEANPILDTELQLPGASTRVAAITAPLNPTGLAFAFRRHRAKPWTLPLFINNRMINSLGAGIMSFLVDGTKTMLVAGTRSSGKSSFLGSIMVEIMRRYRIITIEDTLELPVPSLRRLGFNVQSLKVSSALGLGQSEVSAENGIRSTLRLGDSSLIVGEVRSTEAKALYEAMRVGAAANVVAGTIHAASPYGVFDRVVNDIGVPTTSFKATDVIIISNPVKTAAGLTKKRRILRISEVRKDWKTDPKDEQGFVDLMKYNPRTDELEPSKELINGDSDILKDIASNVKQWAGRWEAVWDNINLRANVKQAIVDVANKANDPEMMEAEFAITANDKFHNLSEEILAEVGDMDSKRVYNDFVRWLKKEAKLRIQQK